MCPTSEHQKKDWLIIKFLFNIKDSERECVFLADPVMQLLNHRPNPPSSTKTQLASAGAREACTQQLTP